MACVPCHPCGAQRTASVQVSFLSCPLVIPRHKTQAISHGDKCLNSLSHLAIPKGLFQKIDNELHKALILNWQVFLTLLPRGHLPMTGAILMVTTGVGEQMITSERRHWRRGFLEPRSLLRCEVRLRKAGNKIIFYN